MTYAVYDEMAIWGTGETKEAAWADVENWVSPEDYATARETMQCARMTKWLAAMVDREGGCISFGNYYGVLMTYDACERAKGWK